jgi:REP element-mobilizing transposase RayT
VKERGSGADSEAVVYLITFSCYGARLHGEGAGSVDPAHNLPGAPSIEPNADRVRSELARMTQPAYTLDAARRSVVLESIRAVCLFRGWSLLAAHVRTNHVHAVVDGEATPEKMMHSFKAYATRALNDLAVDAPDCKRWARHGSTRWLRERDGIAGAIRYVVYEQGVSMAVYERPIA